MFSSLRSRLIVSYLSIILVCLLLTGIFLAILLQPLQQQLIFTSLVDKAIPTTFRVREMLSRGVQPREIALQLKEQASEQDIRMFILTPQGDVLADTQEELTGRRLDLQQFQHIRFPQTGGADPNRSPILGRFSVPNGESMFYVALPLRFLVQGQSFILVVAAPRGAGIMADLRSTLLIAGSVAFFLSIVLALIITRSISAPLQRIALAAGEIARGHYDQELHITAPDEVRSLAQSFNVMARQVDASRQAQRDFVANVSHELKTPLTSIQGFSQALLDGTARDEAARRRAAQIVSDETARLARLVDDLLDLARIEAGQIVMSEEPLDVGRLLRRCVEKFALRAEESGVELTLEMESIEQEALSLRGDGDRLAQVFTNLIDNALKHTPHGGRVSVVARPVSAGQQLEISVADNGAGIPAEDLARIFERFYQVDKSRARGGVGLGLAIAREIIQAHGGQIRAESVMNLGTRFTVTLPLSDRL